MRSETALPPEKLVSPSYLRAFLDWCPETGALFWRARHGGMDLFGKTVTLRESRLFNTARAGGRADKLNARGYAVLQIAKRPFLAHRVVWGFHCGAWPDGPLDHINGTRSDNRIDNLRCVTTRGNNVNKALDKRNGYGCHGIFRIHRLERYGASINFEGRTVYLGSFKTLEEAVAARKAAEPVYGYHENHGRMSQ